MYFWRQTAHAKVGGRVVRDVMMQPSIGCAETRNVDVNSSLDAKTIGTNAELQGTVVSVFAQGYGGFIRHVLMGPERSAARRSPVGTDAEAPKKIEQGTQQMRSIRELTLIPKSIDKVQPSRMGYAARFRGHEQLHARRASARPMDLAKT